MSTYSLLRLFFFFWINTCNTFDVQTVAHGNFRCS